MKAVIAFCGFLLCLYFNLAAQESYQDSGEYAVIYHAEGGSFVITLRGEQTVFSAETLRRGNISLQRSGIVHSGNGTTLELQLVPSGTVIKLSENTMLVYNRVDGSGGFIDLRLLYGRMRVVTGDRPSAAGIPPVVIRSGEVFAWFKSGDFGMDYIFQQEGSNSSYQPLLRFYAFRGRSEVLPYGRGSPDVNLGREQKMSVEEGTSLLLDISPSYAPPEKRPVSRDITAFWRLYGFSGSPPLPLPSAARL